MASERVLHSLAAIVLVVGLWLSHQVDPRVRVDRLFLNGRIATIKFTPRLAGPHPNVLMAHGVGASKETLFRLGEALAASGLTCYAIDLPGHGGSSFRFRAHDNAETLREAAQEIGSIDVFVGHSMGAYAGADAIYRHYMAPRLLIALGALPSTKAPLLVLVGRWDEAVPAGHLPPQHLIVSPWADHATEPYDSKLVQAAVEGACHAVGLTPAPVGHWWLGRLLGTLLALASAAWLTRGSWGSLLVLAVLAWCLSPWLGTLPTWRRLPLQVGVAVVAGLIVHGARRIENVPRWSWAGLSAAGALTLALLGIPFWGLLMSLFTLVCLAAWLLGGLAGPGTRGDIAYALLMGYAMGQWIPLPY